jgi:hypothetical protein
MLKMMFYRLAAVLVVLTMILVVAVPAFAGVQVTPVSMEGEVSIGRNVLPSITVTNTDKEKRTTVKAEVKGFGQNNLGTTVALDDDPSPCSAVSLIKLNPDEFQLDPGESKKITVVANIPSEATGGKYATIVVSQIPEPGASTIGRVAISVVLSVSGTSQVNAGQITGINVNRNEKNSQYTFTTTVLNQGDIHIRPTGNITVNHQGLEIGKVSVEPHLILPGYARPLTDDLSVTNTLNSGTFSYKAELDIGGGNKITAEGKFTLDENGNVIKLDGGIGESGKVIVPPINKTKSPLSTKSVDWRLIGEIAGGILIIGILIYLVATRRKK